MFLKRTLIVVFCTAFLAAGFVAGGQQANAGPGGEPGSNSDPLVTKSYVDKAAGQKLSDLERQVKELQEKVVRLQETVSRLEGYGGTPAPGASPGSSGTQQTTQKTGTINSQSGANIRSGPGTNYERIGGLPYGTEVTILKSSGGWYQVRTPSGATGWVFGELLN